MRIGKLVIAVLMAWLAARATADDGQAAPPSKQPPKPASLSETVEKRLVQLDVAVEGDPDAIRAITAEDFALYVGEHQIQGLIVDRLCGDESTPSAPPKDEQAALGPAPVVAPQVARPRATFIFFFDQTHLTTLGRANSLETAWDLIARLVVDGSRASSTIA